MEGSTKTALRRAGPLRLFLPVREDNETHSITATRLIHLKSLTWVMCVATFPHADISCVISNLFLISITTGCCQEAGHTVQFV